MSTATEAGAAARGGVDGEGVDQHPSTSAASSNNHSTSNSASLKSQQATAAAAILKTPDDFKFISTLGEGSFSTVYYAKEVDSDKEFAIKVCLKSHIRREKKVEYVKREKDVLVILNKNPHPFFITLFYSFQDNDRLYFVITKAARGELLDFMRKLGSFDDEVTRFYAAEIILALEHLHKCRVVHRDLKPENILMTENMHILVSDFGSAKIMDQEELDSGLRPTPLVAAPVKKRSSFVGTAQYVSPEVLNGQPVGPSCDYWALGCIIYQMLSGLPPFRAANEYLVFKKIGSREFSYPSGFQDVPKDLVDKLIVIEPTERLNGTSIKEHDFFSGVKWDGLWEKEPPQLHPYLPASGDQPAFRSDYECSNIQPGLNERELTRLLGDGFRVAEDDEDDTEEDKDGNNEEEAEKERRKQALIEQRKQHPFHQFVQNNLILKSGLVDKRKGLFARRRMLLLTEGPHLYYVDPSAMVLKGEIPWSADLRTEAKNFKTYFVHTPNRTYYLEDPDGNALRWCEEIDKVRARYYSTNNTT